MKYEVRWTPQSMRDMKRLDPSVARRILDGVRRLANEQYGDVRKLAGYDDEYRLRIGDWRVRFTVDTQAKTLIVLRVLHRSDAYKS